LGVSQTLKPELMKQRTEKDSESLGFSKSPPPSGICTADADAMPGRNQEGKEAARTHLLLEGLGQEAHGLSRSRREMLLVPCAAKKKTR